MATANELLQELALHHEIDLRRYGNGILRRMTALLNKVDADIVSSLGTVLERMDPSAFTVHRLEQLLAGVRSLNAKAYEQLNMALTQELRDVVQYEADRQAEMLTRVTPPRILAEFTIVEPPVGQVFVAAMSKPFQGRLLSEWSASLSAARMTRIRDTLRMGYVEGQTIQQMVQRIRGTRAAQYQDGIINIDRRHAEAVVRTATSHVAAEARSEVYKANDDLIKAERWVSTLDTRTTEACMLRDGLLYSAPEHKPQGHSIPWGAGPGKLHWNCRSVSVPVLKSWRELGFNIDELPASTRASMDGQVPENQKYGQWLRKQSAERQAEILGPNRAALMRKGGLTLSSFADDKGRWLTLEELRERDDRAFTRAGL